MNVPRDNRRISTLRLMIFSLVPVVVLLAAGEVGLRGWAYYFRTSYERYNYARGRLELVPNIDVKTAHGEFRINSKGFLGPEWPDEKPDGVYRIFALGDSCTFGDGDWRRAYPALLEESLNASDLGRRFEVINAGIEGYNSEYALDRVKAELLPYKPDMVILYVGWNDLMKVNPYNAAATGRHTWLGRAVETSYLIKAYRKLLFFYVRPLVMSPKPGGDYRDVHALDNFVPRTFQTNLESIVETLQASHVQPVLLTLPTVVEPGMTAEALKQRHVVFPYYAGSYSVGRFVGLHHAYNEVIRNTAIKYEAPLVDVDKGFNSFDKGDLFWDTMHPSHKGHVLIAKSILDVLKGVRLRNDLRPGREAGRVGFSRETALQSFSGPCLRSTEP